MRSQVQLEESALPLDRAISRRARRLAGPLHAEVAGAIRFDSGYAFPGILPDLTRAAERTLRHHRSEALQYGSPFGLVELREWISRHLKEDGVDVGLDEILIVNGAKRGLELICRLFTEEGDAVVVTAPTYFTAIPILRSFGLEFIDIPQDTEGLDVDALRQRLRQRDHDHLKQPKFIYDVPDFHNPTGITMSRRRREELLSLATDRGIAVVEDSPYRKLRFAGLSEPSLKALDRERIVFGLGTFSKLLAPGLRIGWISGPPAMLARMAQLKSDGGTSPLTSRIIVEYFKEGCLPPHLDEARATYALHRDLMVEALREELPDVEFAVPDGGYYLWLRFPGGTDATAVAERALEAGVSVIPWNVFFPNHENFRNGAPSNYIRLAYSYAAPEEILKGVKRLAGTYRAMT